jgi:Mn2+/Fe2+ NRAMP family transporter
VDAGFGGTAVGSHQLAGIALIAAALVLALLVVVIARRQRSESGSTR